jgi:hypothetical protein
MPRVDKNKIFISKPGKTDEQDNSRRTDRDGIRFSPRR